LVRAAIEYAIRENRKYVTLVHKGNIMKFTEGSFKIWGYELAEREFGDKVFTWSEYDRIKEQAGKEEANKAQEAAEKAGKIIVKDTIADIVLQQILMEPDIHDVVATVNLNGDYMSDAFTAQLAASSDSPAANRKYETVDAIFTAIPDPAPAIPAVNKEHPTTAIHSAVPRREQLASNEAAQSTTEPSTKPKAPTLVPFDL